MPGRTLWNLITGGAYGLGLAGFEIFPISVIGGLDNIPGAIVSAILKGVVESLATGYLNPYLGGGYGLLASYGAHRRNLQGLNSGAVVYHEMQNPTSRFTVVPVVLIIPASIVVRAELS